VEPKGDQSELPIVNSRDLIINKFSKGKDSRVGDSHLNLVKYTSNWGTGPRNVGAAYKQPVFEAGLGCSDCPYASPISVDGAPYPKAQTPSPDFYMMVQPDSGYTYQNKKQSSYVQYLSNVKDNGPAALYSYSPLIEFDKLGNTAIPLYDFEENMQADNTTFVTNLSFIASNHKKMHVWFLTLLSFGLIFLVLGLVAVCLTKLQPGDEMTREQKVASLIAFEDKYD